MSKELEDILFGLILPQGKVIPYAEGDQDKAEMLGRVWRYWAEQEAFPLVRKVIAQIEAHYISKADVLKALGEEVEVASIKDLEERVYVIPAQNQLRSQIKKELNL